MDLHTGYSLQHDSVPHSIHMVGSQPRGESLCLAPTMPAIPLSNRPAPYTFMGDLLPRLMSDASLDDTTFVETLNRLTDTPRAWLNAFLTRPGLDRPLHAQRLEGKRFIPYLKGMQRPFLLGTSCAASEERVRTTNVPSLPFNGRTRRAMRQSYELGVYGTRTHERIVLRGAYGHTVTEQLQVHYWYWSAAGFAMDIVKETVDPQQWTDASSPEFAFPFFNETPVFAIVYDTSLRG